MTDDTKLPEGGNGPEGTTHTPEETQALIKQLREEAKAYRLQAKATEDRLTQREKEEAAREAKLLEEQGKFKELYEKQQAEFVKVKTDAEQAAAYQSAFQLSLDARIAAIPEGMRSLVPDGLEPLKLSEWLDKNSALLSNRRAPNLDAGAGSSAGPSKGATLTAADVDMARAMNISPEAYAKQKAAMFKSRGITE